MSTATAVSVTNETTAPAAAGPETSSNDCDTPARPQDPATTTTTLLSCARSVAVAAAAAATICQTPAAKDNSLATATSNEATISAQQQHQQHQQRQHPPASSFKTPAHASAPAHVTPAEITTPTAGPHAITTATSNGNTTSSPRALQDSETRNLNRDLQEQEEPGSSSAEAPLEPPETTSSASSACSNASSSARGVVSRRGRFVSPARRSGPSPKVSQKKATLSSSSSNSNNNKPIAPASSKVHPAEQANAACSMDAAVKRPDDSSSVLETAAPPPTHWRPQTSTSKEAAVPSLSISVTKSPLSLSSNASSKPSQGLIEGKEKLQTQGMYAMEPVRARVGQLVVVPSIPFVPHHISLSISLDILQPKSPHPSDHLNDFSSLLNSPVPGPSIFFSSLTQGKSEEKKNDSDHSDEPSSPAREQHQDDDRDQYLATPTDFASDYGKSGNLPPSFDTSNVLKWLHSPGANGLFSPGFGSILNTPRTSDNVPYYSAGLAPRTPRTPTVSTSFFFSDAANLPRNSNTTADALFSASNTPSTKRNGIICISPLATGKGGRSSHGKINTPLTTGSSSAAHYYKDVFASPKSSSLPFLLSETPSSGPAPRVSQRGSTKDPPNLDACVHLAAERELMEDEDLSVLLQLASNTPRPNSAASSSSAAGAGGTVFRSNENTDSSNTAGKLQLPMIGDAKKDKSGTSSKSLQQNQHQNLVRSSLRGQRGRCWSYLLLRR